MTTNEHTPAPGRTRWIAGAELVAAGLVLALAPREAAGVMPGVWLLGGLLALGSVGLWLRGKGWADVGLGSTPHQHGELHVLLGLGLGALAALAAGFLVGPGLAAITSRGLDAGAPAALQGGAMALVLALVVVWAHALGAEMIFRGWLLDRAERAWPGAPDRDAATGRAATWPLVLAGLAYGWYLGDGSAGSFASGALLGVGLCLLRRAGQSLTLPIATHGAYASTHLLLVYAGVLGGAG
jgi:membrane protease YdiL (CAAX protease family)